MPVPTKSTQPLTYFSAVISVTSTPATLYDLLNAYFQATRSVDLVSTAGGGVLSPRTYRLIQLQNNGTTVVNYGDYTTSTTIGVQIVPTAIKYEQSYSDVQSVDITQRVVCSVTGTNAVAVECWR